MSDDAQDGAAGAGNEPGHNSKGAPAKNLDGAFIQPDEPIPHRHQDAPAEPGGVRPEVEEAIVASGERPIEEVAAMASDDAYISPDEPIPHRDPVRPKSDFDLGDVDPADVVVTGMGDDAHLDPEELAAGGDPFVMELTEKVAKLAEALKHKGEAGLRTGPGMGRFDVTLRAYCVGYLAGRKAEQEGGKDY